MPKNSKDLVECINGHGELQRQPSYYFLLHADKTREGKIDVLLSNGIPLTLFVCKTCGYTESYAAMLSKEWNAVLLYYKCKNSKCKRDNKAPTQVPQDDFENFQFEENQLQCAHCMKANAYSKDDLFYK